MAEIFISHSVADKPVIDDFFILLQTGAGVMLEEAFISSVPGTGVPTGEPFVAEILEALRAAKLVIVFVTPNYWASRFCIAELGGAWALGTPVFPLVVDTLSRELGANMLGTQTERVDTAGLNRLFDRLKALLPQRKWDTDRWEIMRDRFLGEFKEKSPRLPQPDSVDRATLDKELRKTATLGQLLTEAQAQVKTLQEHVRLLEQAKDAKDVHQIRRQFSSEYEQYESLVSDAIGCLKKVGSRTIIHCIYGAFSGLDWYPSREYLAESYQEIDRLVQTQRILTDDKSNPSKLWAYREHPGNRDAFAAIEALEKFLSDQMSAELAEQLEQELNMPVNIGNREYWETVLLEGRILPD